MGNRFYVYEKAFEERQRDRMREVEQDLRAAQALHHNRVRHIIGRSGRFLVMLGKWLEQVEESGRPQGSPRLASHIYISIEENNECIH